MKKFSFLLLAAFFCFNSFAQFKNVKLVSPWTEPDPLFSPTLSISKSNPKSIVINVGNERILASTDGGENWEEKKTKPSTGASQSSVLYNSKGGLFQFQLSSSTNQKLPDQLTSREWKVEGNDWENPVTIAATPSVHLDHPTATGHVKRGTLAMTWTQFDNYGSDDANCQSNIFFSRSGNGNRWSKPVQINESPGDCADDDFTAKGAKPVIGTDDKIYVTWANRGNIYFDRSFDEGANWLQNDLVIAKQEGGWKFDISSVGNNVSLPILAIDNNLSRFHGQLYVVWADQKNGHDDTDVWLIRSMNRGDYWSKPLRVNKDSSRTHQFAPSVCVDPTNGYVYIAYYDRRNYEDDQTDVYLSYSSDGANTFSEVKISENYFIPEGKNFTGHIALDVNGGNLVAVWARSDHGETSLWTCRLKDSDLVKKKK